MNEVTRSASPANIKIHSSGSGVATGWLDYRRKAHREAVINGNPRLYPNSGKCLFIGHERWSPRQPVPLVQQIIASTAVAE
jgi:hypothetical protein